MHIARGCQQDRFAHVRVQLLKSGETALPVIRPLKPLEQANRSVTSRDDRRTRCPTNVGPAVLVLEGTGQAVDEHLSK